MAKRLKKKSIAEEMRDRATGNNQTYTVEERKDTVIPKQDMTPTPTLQDRINKHYVENMQNLANTTMNMVTNTAKRNPIVNSFMAGFNSGKNVELPQNQVKTIQNAVKKDLQTNTQDKRNPYTIMQDRNNQKKEEEEGHKKDVSYKPYQLPQAQEMVNKNQQEVDERKKNEEAQGLLSQVQNRTLPQAQKQEEAKKPTLTESIEEYLRTGDIRKSAGNYFKSQFEGGKQGAIEFGQYYNETLPSKVEGDSWTKRKSEEQYKTKEYREGLLNDVKQNPDNYSKEQKSFIKNQQEFTEKYGDNFYEAYKNESKEKVNKMIEEAPTEIDRKLIEIGQSNGRSTVGAGFSMLSPIAGTMYFYGSSAQSYYDSALEMGMAESDAWKYANVMGAWETVSEELITANRVDQVNKILTGSNIGKTGMKFLGNSMVENAFQEALSEPIDDITKSMLNYSYLNEGQLGERMLESGMIGAISALLMDSPTAVLSAPGDIVNLYNKSVEKIGKKATIEKMQKGAETYYAQILSEINNGLGNDSYEMMRNQNIQEENELSRLLPGQYENQQEIDRTRDEKLKAITEDMTEGDKTAYLIQNSNLSQEEKDSLSRVARRLNVSAEQIDDLLKFNEEQKQIQSENNELEQMIDNSNLTKEQIGEVLSQKSFEEAKNKINELTEENNANQEAIKTLGLNISEENKEGNILYKEKQNIEINDSDTLESSYKKYFGENETSFVKRLKNLDKAAIESGQNVKLVFDGNYFKDDNGNIRTGTEAAFVTKDGKRIIAVNPYATTGKAFEQVLAHELTHAVLSEENADTQALYKSVQDYLTSKGEYDNIVKDLKGLYGKNYNEEEVVAKTIERLFNSKEELNSLANSNPNIFTRIYRSLVGMYAKITGSEKAYLKKMKLDMELAWKNSNNKGSLQDAAKYSFGGENAKTANIGTLKQAKELKKQGLSNEEIFEQTGWYEGNEGKWRFEIDNSEDLVQLELEGEIKEWDRYQAKKTIDENNKKIEYHQKRLEKLTPGTEQYNKEKGFIDKYTNENKGLQSIVGNTKVKISSKNLNNYYGNSLKDEYPITDLLKADKLFEAYPQLKDIKIRFDTTRGQDGTIAYVEHFLDESGKIKPANNYIYITKYGMDTINDGQEYDLKKTLLHELQHKIQDIEGFSRGSSWKEWYRNKTNDIRNRLYNITRKYIDKELKKNNAPYIWNVENEVIRNDLYKMERLADNSIRQYIENPEDFELTNVQRRGLEVTLGEKETNKFYKILEELKDYRTNGKALEYYKNTAGEIESREVEKRVDMTPDERSRTLPFIKDKNTVYSETMSKKPGNQANIKYSIEDSQGRKLTKEQQEFFKDVSPELKDENGNIKALYHGSNSKFTIFDLGKSGESSKEAKVGFWFTENKQGAKNFADEAWWGDKTPTTYEVYLNIKNPKVYEQIDTSKQQEELRNEIDKLQRDNKKYYQKYEFADTSFGMLRSLYTYATYGDKNYDDQIEYFVKHGFTEQEAKQVISEVEEYNKAAKQISKLQKELDNLGYDDAYEQFRSDLYSYAGQTPNEANTGGIGMSLNDLGAMEKMRNDLIKQGYDGIVIKDTRYDAGAFGGKNTQYVAFNPNQIKNIDNKKPTENPDIRYSIEPTNKDNQGRTLSEQQQEYFKDSKVRDENGNLITVYHGTEANIDIPKEHWFTIFDENSQGLHGSMFGDGFYFTTNKQAAQDNYAHSRGNVYETYLNITNPYNPFEDPNIPDGLTYYDCLRFNFPELSNYKGRIPGDIISNTLKDHGYDGIKLDDDYIAFYSNQIKNVDNKKPTSNPDIRYSIETEEFNRRLAEQFPTPATHDKNGDKLAEGMKDFMSNSKARDLRNGGLVNVFHTTGGYTSIPQFNEFDPRRDGHYKFGNQIVNYFTDDKEMSGSYANQDYNMADTRKITSFEEADDLIEEYNLKARESNIRELSLQKNDDGSYSLIDEGNLGDIDRVQEIRSLYGQEGIDLVADYLDSSLNLADYIDENYGKTLDDEAVNDLSEILGNYDNDYLDAIRKYPDPSFAVQEEIAKFDNAESLYKNITSTLQEQEVFQNKSTGAWQYSGYVNIQNPYVIDAEGRNWNMVESESNEFIDELDEEVPQEVKDNLTRLYRKSEDVSARLREEASKYDVAVSDLITNSQDNDTVAMIRLIQRLDVSGVENLLNGYDDVLGTSDYFGVADTLKSYGIIDSNTFSEIMDEYKLPENIKEWIKREWTKELNNGNGVEIDLTSPKIKNLQELFHKKRDAYHEFEKYRYPQDYFVEKIMGDPNDEDFVDLGRELSEILELRAEMRGEEEVAREIAQAASVGFSKPQLIRVWGTSKTTNDIVKQVIKYNNSLFEGNESELAEEYGLSDEEVYKNRTPEELLAVGGYDGVIIKNVVDYGGKAENVAPHDLYITFGSEQFKSKDNKNPTLDKDIRYSEQTETADEILDRLLEKYRGKGERTYLPGIPKNLPKDYIMELGNKIEQMSIPDDKKLELYNLANTNNWNEESYNNFMNDLDGIEQDFKSQQQRNRFTTKAYDNPDRAKLITRKHNEFNKDYHYNDKLVDELDSLLPRNRNGKRTVKDWKQFAYELGKRMGMEGYSPDDIEDIAVKSYYDLQPSKNITKYDNKAKKSVGFERLYANDWVNSVYEGLNEAGYDVTKYSITDNGQNNEQVNQPILPEQQTPQLPQAVENTQPIDDDLQAIRDNSLLNLEQNGKSRKHYKTYAESESLSRKDKNQAKKLYQDELYIPVHNVDSLAKANDRIRTNGIDNEYTAAMTNFTNGNKASLDDIVTMERMIQIYSAQGDTEKVNELMQNVAILGTELGQRVQALSIIKKMSPEGQLQALHKLIDRTNKKEGTDLKITDEQANKILNSNGEKQLQDNVSKVVEEVAKDLKVTFGDEVRAWRYFSMLGNPRTHIRNLVGNTFMNALQGIKNKVAGAGEDVVSLFNPNLERTKTLKIANRDQRDFAKIDSYTMQDVIDGGGKYDMKNMLQQARRSSNIPLLNAMENFNSNLLDKEDKVFLRIAYEQAMRNYMAANNLSKKDMQKKENLEKARQYATLSAQEATFHQFNSIAQILSQLENKGGVTGFLTSAVLPFKKTPMNIAKTGLEYSPIGIASATTNTFNNIFKDSKKLKTQLEKKNITQEQYNSAISDMVNKRIDQMAKGLTGTAIAVLGYVLAKNGVIKAGNGDDEDEFEEKLGNQTFSIRIGDQTYSLDWLAPSAIPLFVGANMSNLVNGDEESTEEETFYDRLGKFTNTTATSLAQAFEPMTEMSMLQGLSSAISSYEQDSSSKLFDIGASAVQSYGGQFIPTAFGQIAKTIDPVVRDTTSTKKGMAKKIDQFVNQQKAKIPVLSKTLPAKTNVWGEDKERPENALVRFLENAVAPYNREKIIEDTTSEKLKEVYEETGEKGALPGTVQKYVTINSERYDLNNKDFNQAKRVYGKVAKKTLDSVISNRSFDSLDSGMKAKLIGDIYSYAKEEFKDEFAKSKGLEFEHKVSNSKKKYAAFKEYESGTKSLSELIEEFYTEKGE